MSPREMTTILRVTATTQPEPDAEEEVPVAQLLRRKRSMVEASTSAPPFIQTQPEQTTENIEAEEDREGHYATLWSDPDQIPAPLINPRQAFHEAGTDVCRQVLSKTMPPRGMTTSLQVAASTQPEADTEEEVPVPQLHMRKRLRVEASTSAPPFTQTQPEQTLENVEAEEDMVGYYANLWSDPNQIPAPLMNPRQAFHEAGTDIRRRVLSKTYAQLVRATTLVADYGLMFEELDAANDQNKVLEEKLQQAEEARQAAQDEAKRYKEEIEHAETSRARANKAKEQSDKAAEAFQKQLEESKAKIKELEEHNKFLENECAGAVEDTWNNCLTQIRFHFPDVEIDESRISRFHYIDNGVVMTLVDNVPVPVHPESANPDIPLSDSVDA